MINAIIATMGVVVACGLAIIGLSVWFIFKTASFLWFAISIVLFSAAWFTSGFAHWLLIAFLVISLLLTIAALIPNRELS